MVLVDAIPEQERSDLHVHLENAWVPGKTGSLIREAVQNRTPYIGLLQHGTVKRSRMDQAVRAGNSMGVKVVPGVEQPFKNTDDRGEAIHYELVALGYDLKHPRAIKYFDCDGELYAPVHNDKVHFQVGYLVDILDFDMRECPETRRLWVPINSREQSATAYELCKIAVANPENQVLVNHYRHRWADFIEDHYRNRPADNQPDNPLNFAKVLYWKTFAFGQDGFRRWGESVPPKEFIEAAHEAGGCVVVAHPEFQHVRKETAPITIAEQLYNMGVDGLEGWWAGPLNTVIHRMNQDRDKLTLGGSDKSIDYKNRTIGLGDKDRQDMDMPASVLRHYQDYCRRMGFVKLPI